MASRLCICFIAGLIGSSFSQQHFVMLIGEYTLLSFQFSMVVFIFLCFHKNCIAQEHDWTFFCLFSSSFSIIRCANSFLNTPFLQLINALTCTGNIFLATFSSYTYLVRRWQGHSSFWDVTCHQIEAWTFFISMLSQQGSLLKKREEALHCGFLTFLLVLEQTLFPGWFYRETQSQLELLVLFLGYLLSVSL